jgi:hypothetical protein
MKLRSLCTLLVLGVCISGNAERGVKYATINSGTTEVESLPAKEYSAGNWGAVSNGIQLSLRFTNQVCRIGEPCFATVVWRNATNTPLMWVGSSERPEHFEFSVTDENGKVIKSKSDREHSPWEPTSGSSYARGVAPGEQMKFEIDLARYFAFRRGSYRIIAKYRCPRPDQPPEFCSSAETQIRFEIDR